mgnify:CR=1 FL=1
MYRKSSFTRTSCTSRDYSGAVAFPAIWPQYKYEPGIWMLGILVLFLTAFYIAMDFLELNSTDLPANVPHSAYGKYLISTCIAALTIFGAFTTYACDVNFRLSRKRSNFSRR